MHTKEIGRPSEFTPAIAEEICERIGRGEPLTVICRDEHMPHRTTVAGWCRKHSDFGESFASARELGSDWIAAECLKIADMPLEGIRTKMGKDGEEITREDMLGHRKLQIETRLKRLAKWDPKRYGEKLDVNACHSGEIKLLSEATSDHGTRLARPCDSG
jgi:hypothetical protein